MDSNGSFVCVWYKKNAEHTARPKMNAVIRSMHSRIVDTDIGECDRVDDRCGRWLATIVCLLLFVVVFVVVVVCCWVNLLLSVEMKVTRHDCGNLDFILFLQQTSAHEFHVSTYHLS